MPIPAYAWFKDDSGGDVAGSVTISGREGSSEVMEFLHDVHIPTDLNSGRTTGVRVHQPVKLVKSFDSASPLLYQACCQGKTLKEVEIKWYSIDDTGAEKEYFTHKLENAKVASVRAIMPNTKDPDKERYVHLEEVSLVYEKITWKFVEGNKEFQDDWLGKR
jgi:type VI secretion system secreted protein Hcp